jgi:hypothetical protein
VAAELTPGERTDPHGSFVAELFAQLKPFDEWPGRNVGIEYRWADQAECESFEVRYSWQKATLLSVSCHISCRG